jgi:putative two-component system response regulator
MGRQRLPQGLAGEAIPVAARLMALADVFDALICKRHYKEPYLDRARRP